MRAHDVISRFEAASNTYIHEDNVYSPLAWIRLKKITKERKIDSFDLIIAKPEGAFQPRVITAKGPRIWDSIDEYQSFFLRLLEKAYLSLSSDNGILLFQIPSFAADVFKDKVIPIMESNNIEVHWVLSTGDGHPTALIKKSFNSPESLEKLVIDNFNL